MEHINLKKEDPKISFLMAAFNSEEYIGKAIESVLRQTVPDWELVIIIDEGTTDNTREVVATFDDSRIKVIGCKHTPYPAVARNEGLSLVQGKYIQLLDSDDFIDCDFVEKLQYSIRDKKLDIVIPNAKRIGLGGEVLAEWIPEDKNYKQVLGGEESFGLSINWHIHGWYCVRASILKNIKYFTKTANGDELTSRMLLYYARRVGFADTSYYYIYNENSITNRPIRRENEYSLCMTDYYLYRFAVEKEVNISIIRECEGKLLRSLRTVCLCYEDDYLKNDGRCRNYHYSEIKWIHKRINAKFMIESKSKYLIPVILSFGNTYLMIKINVLIRAIRQARRLEVKL